LKIISFVFTFTIILHIMYFVNAFFEKLRLIIKKTALHNKTVFIHSRRLIFLLF